MQLTVLGSGTAVPHRKRASSAFWLETAGGTVLLDCSVDALHRMAAENLDWPNLDAIWISHLHLDHCGGLAPLLFGMRNAPITQNRTKPLTIFGCQGTANLLTTIDNSNGYKLFRQPFPLQVREFAADETNEFELLAQLRARLFSTPHTPESLAIRLSDKSASLVYTSDTGYTEALADFVRGVDLLLVECSFWRDKPTPKHLELAEAMRLAKLAEPRRVVLTHLYPEWDGIDIESHAKQLWPGATIAAFDGLRVEIG